MRFFTETHVHEKRNNIKFVSISRYVSLLSEICHDRDQSFRCLVYRRHGRFVLFHHPPEPVTDAFEFFHDWLQVLTFFFFFSIINIYFGKFEIITIYYRIVTDLKYSVLVFDSHWYQLMVQSGFFDRFFERFIVPQNERGHLQCVCTTWRKTLSGIRLLSDIRLPSVFKPQKTRFFLKNLFFFFISVHKWKKTLVKTITF